MDVGRDGNPDMSTKKGTYKTDKWQTAAKRAARQLLKGGPGHATFFVYNKDSGQAIKVKATKKELDKPREVMIAGKTSIFKYTTDVERVD